MSTDFDSFSNRGEYFAAHYFAEQLGTDLKKGLFATWALREGDEHDPRKTPRELLRSLRGAYLSEDVRGYFAEAAERDAGDEVRPNTHNNPEWRKRLAEWHHTVLQALGFEATPTEVTVHRAGRDHYLTVAYHGHGIIALDCGWAADNDAALNATGPGRLLHPLRVSASEIYETGPALASWLFQSELGEAGGPRPRFVLLLCGGVLVLADRQSWNEGRFLAVNLDAALERNDRSQQGELATIAALFSLDMLRPGENDQSRTIDALLKSSSANAAGVSGELRHGLQRSVEIIANEVLARMAEPENNVTPADIESPKIPFARELTRESLRYLYRVLFLLYAEARPELGILPADDGSYEAGYSMARLRELVERDEELVEEEARNGFHLHESLDVLFNKVNFGHRPYGTEADDDQPGDDEETRKAKAARRSDDRGLRFEPLRSELFEPRSVRLIGRGVLDPRSDEDSDPRWLDLRLRNAALHEVLRLLTMKKGKRGERGGFISYRNLGINQLGAVYEGLMSYTGIIAEEELCEVAKGGDPEKGSWLIPSKKQDQYPDKTLVHYDEDDARKGLRGVKKYEKGSFVYRLAGRDRETSASYYTPESLTQVTVELTLKHRLDQERNADGNAIKTRASELLKYKICEPALGSGAFLNEAINQVAEEYLRRRQDELGVTIPTADALTEKQQAKAYIALHNAYGVDLNATGVELAEVSLWLNTMHPGMRAPWFGLHLRRGNSLIGARRAVYAADDVTGKEWLKAKGALAPTPLPFLKDGEPQPLPQDAVHQFLLPSPGWAAVAGSKEAKELAKESVDQLAAWKKGILQRPKRGKAGKSKKEPVSQFTRLRDAARRVEFLWSLVVKRMELSERAIARRIDVWGADPTDPEFAFLHRPDQAVPKEQVLEDLFNAADTPYWRLKKIMDAWCALWFWPVDKAGLLDGTAGEYAARLEVTGADNLSRLLDGAPLVTQSPAPPADPEPVAVPTPTPAPRFVEATALFAFGPEQTSFEDLELSADDSVVEVKEIRPRGGSQISPPKPKAQERRAIVPLKDLDDWLEFLEAMLGTADVPEGTLIDSFKDLEALKSFEETLPGFMGMDAGNPEDRFPWLREVHDIAEEQGFLNWELEFALVFAHGGGFDIQVGNPPWVRPQWDELAVLAEFDPWFKLTDKHSATEKSGRRTAIHRTVNGRAYVLSELTSTSSTSAFLSSTPTYPLLAGTRPDLYRAFMCRTWSNTTGLGIIGLIHPDTHFTGDKEARLREEAYHRLRVHADFVNPGHRFFPAPVGESSHFGLHIYGPSGEIGFDHLCWLFSVDALRFSESHDENGEAPGVRFKGALDERPHRARIIRVDLGVLAQWQRLIGKLDQPTSQSRLLSPVSTAEAEAIKSLADYPTKLGQFSVQVSQGFYETPTRDAGIIEYRLSTPEEWSEVILKGPQIGVATPLFKAPNAGSNDVLGMNLMTIADDAVPQTEYRRAIGRAEYEECHDKWFDHGHFSSPHEYPDVPDADAREFLEATGASEGRISPTESGAATNSRSVRSYTNFYRLAWRRQIAPDTERSLYAAVIPPGPAHVDLVNSLTASNNRETVLNSGFWASIPLDYFLRTTGRSDLRAGDVRTLPAPNVEHPLASPLTLRTLRLNCLTDAYSELWAELYDAEWPTNESWAYKWPGIQPLNNVRSSWERDTPLRSERARRAALVEIDALVAVWIGLSAEALIAMYRARFPVMNRFEETTWFDAEGWKIAGNARTVGQRQTKESWAQFKEFQVDPASSPVPDGYTAPFYRADREAEMRAAHAYFQKRLDEAVARGEWDPVKQEVPKP
ncbi:hypothetical protein [Streptomyces pilosus]|uniref:site-specific DNA-methyltransferase (adenine-specific) n=1 Tax=Streptomyces pilosus TaxID=28893 RepID=A0A918BI81_9ACTN|nr:hypothetical protein [Streptomyces pilosus]GGQ67613.1 hypothetical protein GCM10010280_12250 [Streptomyces pilosus]